MPELDCRRIPADLAEAAAADGQARGWLAVTAPQMFGRLHVAPVVLDFLRAQPQVQVHRVYPAGRRAPAKARAFIEFACDRLTAEPVLRGEL